MIENEEGKLYNDRISIFLVINQLCLFCELITMVH